MTSVLPASDPPSYEGTTDAWLISSYPAARSILVDPDARVPLNAKPPYSTGRDAVDVVVERGVHLRGLWVWGSDDDRRAVCRKIAATAVGSGSVQPLVPYLEARAATLLDSNWQAPEVDLVTDYARPLVRDSLMELLGVPQVARASLEARAIAMAGFIPGGKGGDTADYFALAATAGAFADLWSKPLPPLAAASRVLSAAVDSGELSTDEALAQATLLLFGNSYTTLDALVGLMARLSKHRDLWRAAQTGALAIEALVEEGLRLGPPEHLVLFRDAARDIECAGDVIPAGARIVLPLGRLNRDPTCFADPDAFEPNRQGPPHLAFGAGMHMCLGLHLARTVIRIGVKTLLARMPEWPAETRIDRAPSKLGGTSISSLLIPAGALRRC